MAAPNLSARVVEHITEAQANYRRYESMLKNQEDISWSVVFLFYSALHLVQAYAHHYTPDDIPKYHEDRAGYVSCYYEPEIAEKYIKLEKASMQARYYLVKFSLADVRRLHDDTYAKVRKHLREQNIAWQTSSSSNNSEGGVST